MRPSQFSAIRQQWKRDDSHGDLDVTLTRLVKNAHRFVRARVPSQTCTRMGRCSPPRRAKERQIRCGHKEYNGDRKKRQRCTQPTKTDVTLVELCVSPLRKGHANRVCDVRLANVVPLTVCSLYASKVCEGLVRRTAKRKAQEQRNFNWFCFWSRAQSA